MWGSDEVAEVAIFGEEETMLHVLQLLLSGLGYRTSILGENELEDEGRVCELSLLILAPRLLAGKRHRILSTLNTPAGWRLPRLELVEGREESAGQPGNSVKWPCCSGELHRRVRQALGHTEAHSPG